MGKKRTYSTLDGHTEVYRDEPDRSITYLKITRHMPKKCKTYFCYYFYNPRNGKPNKDPREPDVYRYNFRIFWKKDGPVLYEYKQYITSGGAKNCDHSEWTEASKTSDFNLFPNYTGMVQRIQSIIAEHYLLTDLADSNKTEVL